MFVHKTKPYMKVEYLRYKNDEDDDAGKKRLGVDWTIPNNAIRVGDILTLPEFKDRIDEFTGK